MGSSKEDLPEYITQYSIPVSPSFYAHTPEYFSVFEPRIHKESQLAADAAVQCQIDLFGQANIGSVMATLDTFCGNWTSNIGRGIFALARFAYKIALSDREEALLLPLTKLITEIYTLHNDYYSWEKENDEDKLPISNAVTLFMKWHSMPLEEAKAAVKAAAVEREQQYLQAKEEFWEQQTTLDTSASSTIRKWLDIMEHVIAGNLLWCISCPRFHRNQNNQYLDYYQARCSQGYNFSEDCAVSESFVMPQAMTEPVNGVCSTAGRQADSTEADDHTDQPTTFLNLALEPFDETVIKYPSTYVRSLPSKKMRQTFIDALNLWYHVPDQEREIIASAIDLPHNCSLMLDDMQDESPQRRGRPAAHMIYGRAQTMNSAYYMCIEALQTVCRLSSASVPIYLEELRLGHLGQAQELYWTYHGIVPSEEDYFRMIDGETTSLFRMSSRLLQSEASANGDLDLSKFITLLGRFFQIQDDYQNLVSADYSEQKGFCEDLDEGKFSQCLIHAFRTKDLELESIIEQRKRHGLLSPALKRLVIDRLRERGSLEYTLGVLRSLYHEVKKELHRLEEVTGSKNWVLRMLLSKLEVGI